jgi:hypothetical protein
MIRDVMWNMMRAEQQATTGSFRVSVATSVVKRISSKTSRRWHYRVEKKTQRHWR